MLLRKNANVIMDKIYEESMISFFKRWIKSYCNIDCFAILVILPDHDMLHLSTHPTLTQVYSDNHYGLVDQPTNQKIYLNFSFYPWRLPNPTKKQLEIHSIREKIFNLNAGTNFVRKIQTIQGEFCIIYCCSTHNKDPLNYFKFAANANAIFEIGDFAYNSLLPIFQENCSKFKIPNIDNFSEINCENITALINNYTLIEKFSDRIIMFAEKSPIIDKADYNFKKQLKLVAKNKIHVNANSKNAEQPSLYLVK